MNEKAEHSVFVFPENGSPHPDAMLVSQLLDAASRGNTRMIASLLEEHAKAGLNASSSDYDKRTALHLAASEGLLDCSKVLVDSGAAVNARDRWQGTRMVATN